MHKPLSDPTFMYPARRNPIPKKKKKKTTALFEHNTHFKRMKLVAGYHTVSSASVNHLLN